MNVVNAIKELHWKRPGGAKMLLWGAGIFIGGLHEWNDDCRVDHPNCWWDRCITALGAVSMAYGGGEGLVYGNWKRDMDGIIHLYDQDIDGQAADLGDLMNLGNYHDLHLNIHTSSGDVHDMLYSYNNETNTHLTWTGQDGIVPAHVRRRVAAAQATGGHHTAAASPQGPVKGDHTIQYTGIGAMITDYDHSQDKNVKAWLSDPETRKSLAQAAIEMMHTPQGWRSVCVGITKPKGNKNVQIAGISLQPATDQTYKQMKDECQIPQK